MSYFKRAFLVMFGALLFTLTTSASAWAVTPPYVEDFESEATCGTSCGNACVLSGSGWTNDTNDAFDWTVDIGGTSSSSTGPSTDHNPGTSTGKYLYTETSGSTCNNSTANLISPPLELANTTNPLADFWFHMYGADMGDMHVDVLDSNQAVLLLDIIPSFTFDVDLWQKTPAIDLSAYIGQTVHLRIRAETGASFGGDMAVDDFRLLDPASDDVGVSAILSPMDGVCGLSMDQVEVTVTNFGGNAQSMVPVTVNITGAVTATLTGMATGPIAPLGGTENLVLSPVDLFAGGAITIDATTMLMNDSDTNNDAIQATATIGANEIPLAAVMGVCTGNSTDLSVMSEGTGYEYGWYDTDTGGMQLFLGDTFTTPPLTGNTTYYVTREEGMVEHVGELDNTFNSGGNFTSFTSDTEFDVTNATTLVAVHVYPNGPGDVVVNMYDSNDTLLNTATVAVTTSGTKTRIPLGWALTPGTGYYLNAVGTTTGGLYRNDGGASFPYVGTDITLTFSSLTNYYYFFYDWEVGEPYCDTERTPVDVVVDPTVCDADLDITIIDTPDPAQAGGQINYTVQVTNNGPEEAFGVAVDTTLGMGVTTANTVGCAEDGMGVPTCTLGDMTAGESAVFSIQVDVDASASGTVTTSVVAMHQGVDGMVANDSAMAETTIEGGSSSGAGGSGAGGGGTGGGATTGSGGSAPAPVEDDSGCGCTTPGNSNDNAPLGMAVMSLLGLALLRRRRR